jgi:hypothetical protein
VNIHKINNLFTEKELEDIKIIINNSEYSKNDSVLGRLQIEFDLPKYIKIKLQDLIYSITNTKLSLGHTLYVEYSNKYGQPNLPPHFDGSQSDMMIDFQLEANTSWDLGINTTTYSIENNSAIIFNPNEYIHWRPHKKFNDQEYIKMIFIRFDNLKNLSDYSHLRYRQDNPVFEEAHKFRDSL